MAWWVGNVLVLLPRQRGGVPRVQLGPHAWTFGAATVLLMLGLGAFFFLAIIRTHGLAHQIIGAALILSTWLAFARTATSNPGLIIKAQAAEIPDSRAPMADAEVIDIALQMDPEAAAAARERRVVRGTTIEGRPLADSLAAHRAGGSGGGGGAARAGRWCGLCAVHMPPGAEHCDDCNVCVAGWDHHCPWVGQCVGSGNSTAFYMFLGALGVLMTQLLYLTVVDAFLTSHGARGANAGLAPVRVPPPA
jgi:hypothetical protein